MHILFWILLLFGAVFLVTWVIGRILKAKLNFKSVGVRQSNIFRTSLFTLIICLIWPWAVGILAYAYLYFFGQATESLADLLQLKGSQHAQAGVVSPISFFAFNTFILGLPFIVWTIYFYVSSSKLKHRNEYAELGRKTVGYIVLIGSSFLISGYIYFINFLDFYGLVSALTASPFMHLYIWVTLFCVMIAASFGWSTGSRER